MVIERSLEQKIIERFGHGRVIIIYGPRRVGKTTLVKKVMEGREDVAYFNADIATDRDIWTVRSLDYLRAVLKKYMFIVIDEAQNIPDVGLVLKVLVDNFPDIQVIATGSSSFDIINRAGEPLTGRKWEFTLFPLTYSEIAENYGHLEASRMLERLLSFGTYPEVVVKPEFAEDMLIELVNSYLLKDVFAWVGIKKPDKLMVLLKALAYQVGSQVSYSEISRLTRMDVSTVERYIDLLEKNFVLFRLTSFNRNLRNELRKSRKIYFWDNGVRNAIIQDFRQFSLRPPEEQGRLWENFVISEIIKHNRYFDRNSAFYFWRTKDGAEVDLVKVKGNSINAYEIKLHKKANLPASFRQAYNPESFVTVTIDNFDELWVNASRFF